MKKMDALEFYKSHESAPLPDIGDLVSLTVEEICELMEQYHQSKVNNGVLDDVIVIHLKALTKKIEDSHCYGFEDVLNEYLDSL